MRDPETFNETTGKDIVQVRSPQAGEFSITIPRTSRAMIEADLVSAVQRHPILYDRSVSGFNRTKMRDDAWREIEKELNVPEAECKKRWRSMRDSFIKLQRTRGGRARWPHLGLMQFLLPHIEIKHLPRNTDEDSDCSDESRCYELPIQPEVTMTIQDSPISFSKLNGDLDDSSDMGYIKRNLNPGDEDYLSCTSCHQSTDPDELFLLSCAPNFKRMDPRQNAVARMRIQQVLFEVEFGASINVDYMGRPFLGKDNGDPDDKVDCT